MALPWMMDIYGPYMASDRLILSMMIRQFLIWLLLMAPYSACVDDHLTSFWSILVAYVLLISTVEV